MRLRFTGMILLMLAVPVAGAPKYGENDPIPPGSMGKILSIQGKILEIRGISSAVSGKSEALASAIKDLGAIRSGTEVRIALASDVLFDFDQATLRPEAAPSLEKVAVVIQSFESPEIRIEGHSDNVGADAYNQRLSERRAGAVQTWLAARQVPGTIATRGWGESKPAVPNTNPDGSDNPGNRQRNRRVEIVVDTKQ